MIKKWKLFNEDLAQPSQKDNMWEALEKEIQDRAKNKDTNFKLEGPWKKYIRDESGYKVFGVDGRWVQNNLCAYFGHGGHGFVHEFIPMYEIWVSYYHPSDGTSVFSKCDCKLKNGETKMSKKFFDSTVVHEISECEAMKEGKDFNQSHQIALGKEKEIGYLNNPYVDESIKIKKWNEFINENLSIDTPDGKVSFYKNIKSFFGEIEPKARGLILSNGYFYIFDCAGESFAIHQQGIDCAAQLKIIKKSVPFKVWKQSKPEEFICVQRKTNTPEIYLSESYIPDTIKKYQNIFDMFIEKAKNKSSQYNENLQFFATQISDEPSGISSYSEPEERIPSESQRIIRHFHEG